MVSKWIAYIDYKSGGSHVYTYYYYIIMCYVFLCSILGEQGN